jgi:integrase
VLCPRPQSPDSFFVSRAGTRLGHSAVQPTFRTLLQVAALEGTAAPRRPRIHHLRHTFAVKTLIGWYRSGADVAACMPMLSTYLGHAEPTRTYWYLSAVPELLALAAGRLASSKGKLS